MCFSAFAKAQNVTYTEKDFAKKPLWIQMIKDTAANFFDVEKAYKIYFQHHEQPGGEHDIIGEHEEHPKKLTKKQLRKMQADDRMRMDVKRYEHWRMQVLPYVKEDGTITGPNQRIEQWKAERKNK